ncbi:MAG: hypothetical protein H7Y86_06130 [Rhizobacter sp.]|nr:hypothetical protein [Ferruginibacter sp.]
MLRFLPSKIRWGLKFLQYFFFLAVFSSLLYGCKKTEWNEASENIIPTSQANSPVMHSRNSTEIEEWLEDKQTQVGEQGGNMVATILQQMRIDDQYSEPFGDENFIIVPINY